MKKIATMAVLLLLSIGAVAAGNSNFSTKNENNFTQKDTLKRQVKSAVMADNGSVVFSTDMVCESCVKKLKENLSYMKGIKKLDISLEKQEISIKYNPKKTSSDKFKEQITKLGYKAEEVKK